MSFLISFVCVLLFVSIDIVVVVVVNVVTYLFCCSLYRLYTSDRGGH